VRRILLASNERYISTFCFFQRNGNVQVFPTANNNISLYTQREKKLRKIIVTTWITLDGFIARPNGEMDWIIVDETMGKFENYLVSSGISG
jgi:hypothetical protein